MMKNLLFSIASIVALSFIVISKTTQIDKYFWDKIDDGNYGCKFDGDGGHINLIERGKVSEVVDANTNIFKSEKGKKRTVNLIAIDSGSNKKKAKAILEENVLNKEAELLYSSGQLRSKNVNGIIEIDGKDINRLMLKLGLAKYKDSKAYQISFFNDCVYFRAEEKAKNDNLGIWAK